MSAAEFADLPKIAGPTIFELVRGRLVKTQDRWPSFGEGLCLGNLARNLFDFVSDNESGRMAFRTDVITERNPDTVRSPRMAYWSYARLPASIVPENYALVSPDLCVETLLEGETLEFALTKSREYLRCGVSLVWILDLGQHTVFTVKPEMRITPWFGSDILTGDPVLPGFECPINELFAPLSR